MIPKEIFKKIREIEITTTHLVDDMLRGAYRSAFKGNGMEFEEVRQYQPGDDIRSIDWNVTARSNFPYVKTFSEERELTVFLLVDLSTSQYFGTQEQTKKELIAEVGATLAFSAIKNNDNVGLILFTDHVERYVPPGKGTRHVLRVIRDLLAFEPKGTKSNLQEALQFLGRVQKRGGAACFLFSDFFELKKASNELKIAARHHDLIAVQVVDPRENEIPNVGLIRFEDMESGKTEIVDSSSKEFREQFAFKSEDRKKRLRRNFTRIGADFLQLKTDERYAHQLRKYFQMRKARFV